MAIEKRAAAGRIFHVLRRQRRWGCAPGKKSVSPPAKSERECIKLRITTNRTLTAHAHYNGAPLLKMYLRTEPAFAAHAESLELTSGPKTSCLGSLDPSFHPTSAGLTVQMVRRCSRIATSVSRSIECEKSQARPSTLRLTIATRFCLFNDRQENTPCATLQLTY